LNRKKIKVGDIYQIPLTDKKYAYGRIFKDACIAIYKELSSKPNEVPANENYQFTIGIYEDALRSGRWKIVEHRPFKSEDESWPPPMYALDKKTGKYSIYHKGEITEGTKKQCSVLEEASGWEAEQIISRILG